MGGAQSAIYYVYCIEYQIWNLIWKFMRVVTTHAWRLLGEGHGQKYHESMGNCSQLMITTGKQLVAFLTLVLFYPMLFVLVSLQKWLGDKNQEILSCKIVNMCCLSHHLPSTARLLSQNLKPWRLILRVFWLSTKVITSENYLPYGILFYVICSW